MRKQCTRNVTRTSREKIRCVERIREKVQKKRSEKKENAACKMMRRNKSHEAEILKNKKIKRVRSTGIKVDYTIGD